MSITKRKAKNGEISYLIRVSLGYDNGKQIIESMTYKPPKDMSPKRAESEANRQAILFEERVKQEYKERLERVEQGIKQATFKELAKEWLELEEITNELKPGSLLRMKNCEERVYPVLGDTLVSKISYRQIQFFITSLSKDGVNQRTGGGLSQKTQKHYLTFISNVMKYAMKCGIITVNPCRDISTVRTSAPTEKVIYSLDETKTLLALINEKAETDYKVFFNLLAHCGMRKGEALGLEYKDIDFNNSVLSIKRTSKYQAGKGIYTDTPKTKTSYRSLSIQPEMLELIKQLRAEQQEQATKCGDLWNDTDRLFIKWDGKAMHPHTPYTWLQRFCEKENVPFRGLHSFRHFVATQAIINGVDIKSVSSVLGHSQTSTTLNIYAHATQKSNYKALNCIANILK